MTKNHVTKNHDVANYNIQLYLQLLTSFITINYHNNTYSQDNTTNEKTICAHTAIAVTQP